MVLPAVVLVMHAKFGRAQQKNGYTGGLPNPRPGTITIHPGYEGEMGNLEQQISWSDTIVDGYVTAVLPSITLTPAIPGNVQTASRVMVNSVLRGTVAAGTELLIIELGGKQRQWNVIDPDNPLVQPGERYILFLNAAPVSIPNGAGLIPDSGAVPRYWVRGYQNGKARVDADGNIRFGSGATQSMAQYNGTPSSSFVSILTDRIAHLFGPPPPYPVGVTPIPLPPNTNTITPLPAKKN
jgi:hypothetical protein